MLLDPESGTFSDARWDLRSSVSEYLRVRGDALSLPEGLPRYCTKPAQLKKANIAKVRLFGGDSRAH